MNFLQNGHTFFPGYALQEHFVVSPSEQGSIHQGIPFYLPGYPLSFLVLSREFIILEIFQDLYLPSVFKGIRRVVQPRLMVVSVFPRIPLKGRDDALRPIWQVCLLQSLGLARRV